MLAHVLLWIAGLLHLLVASVNYFAIKKFDYPGNLAKVSPIVRQVFIVQNVYIVLVQIGTAAMCFFFADELAGKSVVGRCIAGFFAFFWGLRVAIQLFFYDPALKREHAKLNAMFLIVYLYLTSVFLAAAIGLLR